MNKNDNSLRRIESGLKRGLKAQLLQLTRSGQMDGDAMNLFFPNLGRRKNPRPKSMDDYCYPNAMELASCRTQLVEYLENWQPEEVASEKTQTNQKANSKSYNRAVDLWAKTHESLDKTFPPLERAGILERTKSGYNWTRRQCLLLWLLITVEKDFKDWPGVAQYFTVKEKIKTYDQLRAAKSNLRDDPPPEWYKIEELIIHP